MTYLEAEWLLKHWDVPLVRISPNQPHRSSRGHFMRGQLMGAFKTRAVVKPSGHRKPEEIEYQYLSAWRSKMPEQVREAFNKFPSINNLLPQDTQKETKVIYVSDQPQKRAPRIKRTQAEKDEVVRLCFEANKGADDIFKITGIPAGTFNKWLTEERVRRNKAEAKEARKMTPQPVAAPTQPMAKSNIARAIRAVLDLNIPDTSKLLAIEVMVWHE